MATKPGQETETKTETAADDTTKQDAGQQGTSSEHAEMRFKDDPIYARMAGEINSLRDAQRKAEDQRKSDLAAAEQKKLEEQGKWQEIASKAKADLAAKEAEFSAKEKRLTLAAMFAAVAPFDNNEDNEDFRNGLISKCGDKSAEEYVAEIKAARPHLFVPKTAPAAQPPEDPKAKVAQGYRAASGPPKGTFEERLRRGDPSAQREAFDKALRGS